MAASREVDPRWSDPWPSVQPAWQDPPWRLSGRVMTAWFEAPWELIEAAVSPALRPPIEPKVRTRLRFYELAFMALGFSAGQSLAPASGTFREAAIGVPTRYQNIRGDTSVFMWADLDTYVMWAREAFGWPLLRAEIELGGDLWSEESVEAGYVGESTVTDAWGTAAIFNTAIAARVGPGPSKGAAWLTPRRILRHGQSGGEIRELQVVRPVVEQPGTRYTGEGQVRFDFKEPHPLALLGTGGADIDVVDGFSLCVGDDVEIL